MFKLPNIEDMMMIKNKIVCSHDPHNPTKGMLSTDMCEDCEQGCSTERELKLYAVLQMQGVFKQNIDKIMEK